jgi:hypothetical protein
MNKESEMVGDNKKLMEYLKQFNFSPHKRIFLNICGNSLHQKLSTRHKGQHQKVSSWIKPQTPGAHVLVQRFFTGIHILALTNF